MFSFTDGDSNVQISATNSKTYFLVIEMKSDAEENGDVHTFRITFDPDADSVNEDRIEDTSICVADSTETAVQIEIPEFPFSIIPIIATIALFIVFRRRRKKIFKIN